jgi:phenylpropionate dioxygenase-like ring-hydroxylating dioxygenase large terminal subunit
MGLEKVAAYRSPEGELHQVSAVCPHLGGKILHGPSVNELENKG